ncbi:MAG: butyryl-CoA:acetate CoA-transferase [Clostridiales bacterium]|jgi:butyryl-CoA:acetate CoA-transferase|nr:MAG: butyryl-CoA:acetate CoA-transferase [Clostridiales bacterium]
MDYKALYQSKLTTPEEAVKCVHDGDWVAWGWVTNTPKACDHAMAEHLKTLHDVQFRGGILMWKPEMFDMPDAKDHFTWNSWHMSGIERKMIDRGFCFYSPVRYSEVPKYCRETANPERVFFVQCSPMDKHGYFNFGPNASHLIEIADRAEEIIVEVNPNMPRCLGGYHTDIHVSQVTKIIETNNSMAAMPAGGAPSEVELSIAKYVVPLIPDHACLQLGIGGVPNTIGSIIAQSDLKDLGVHTEMYVDAFVDLTMAGKITGKYKELDPGRQVYAFGAGSQKLYDFIDDNPECMCAPVDYVNSIDTISSISNFISINSAIDIDLYGQIAAESSGVRHISGAGGQMDFVMGAYLAPGGKSFICLSSTFKGKDGSIKSRIRPTLEAGSTATCTRANTQYVVTEYGVVNLKGLAAWQRAEGLINISHPDLRDELIAEADKLKMWRRSNKR